jgi:cation:H+ antiporter
MTSQLLLFALGLAALIAGAEALVRGASALARRLRVSPLVVGLTVVAFGTSSPEMAVTVGASLGGRNDVAVGNVVGSNILNVLLILGLSALVRPLLVQVRVIRQEVPVMIGASALFAVLALDGTLGRADAALLVALLVAYTAFLVWQARGEGAVAAAPAGPGDAGRQNHWGWQALLVAAGLALLVLGAHWLVEAATALARALGVSDLVIGLTVVALGTSLPEAAASVLAAARGERDIAVGNVVGSNVFNLLGCLGVAGLLAPHGLAVPPGVRNFDLWVMLAVALACLPVFFTGYRVGRREGAVLLAYGGAYLAYTVLDAAGHDALPPFSSVMMSFVIPLTVVTMLVALLLASGRRSP